MLLKKNGYNQNKILWAVETNSGLTRSRNEDYYIARPAFGLWVLCDGVGGHAEGAMASRVCAETIAYSIIHGKDLDQAIQLSHEAVRTLGRKASNHSGHPCSTVAVLLISERKWTVAWVGDTRVWLFEKKRLQQITRDHTVVRKLLDWGVITEEEAKNHPDRHKVTRAIGIGKDCIEISIQTGAWNSNQVFILGTDGMACRDEPEILSNILINTVTPDQLVDKLAYASLQISGGDNFTIAVVGRSLENYFIRKAVEKSREIWSRRSRTVGLFQPVPF